MPWMLESSFSNRMRSRGVHQHLWGPPELQKLRIEFKEKFAEEGGGFHDPEFIISTKGRRREVTEMDGNGSNHRQE